jgi:hypothetical protein
MFATFGGQVMQEGCVSAGWHSIAYYAAGEVGPDNDLWFAGRGVYRGADDGEGSWSFSNSGRGVKLSVTSLPGSGFSPQ